MESIILHREKMLKEYPDDRSKIIQDMMKDFITHLDDILMECYGNDLKPV